MIKSIFRIVSNFLLSLLLLIIAAHFVLINLPGDPAAYFSSAHEIKSASAVLNQPVQQTLKERGLLLPAFYVSVYSAALPPVYFETYHVAEKRNLKEMAYRYGQPEKIEIFIHQLKRCQSYFSDDSARIFYRQMLTGYHSISGKSEAFLRSMLNKNPDNSSLDSLLILQAEMHQHKNSWKKFIPVFSFHSANRFHQLLFGNENTEGILQGSLGVSWQTRMPVSEMIFSGFKWTFLLSVISLLITLILGMLIGIKAGASEGSVFDKISSQALFILYSVPVFWLAIMLLMLFSNPHALNWLPASGVQPAEGFQEGKSLFSRIFSTIPYLILPLICFILPTLAFMARTLRAATIDIMQQDFIRTAYAKGLPEKIILQKHVLRNVLLPVITLFALAWPALLSGSVVVETIFSIPGIGLLTFQAVQQQDYPVLIGIFITAGAITLATFSLADILYRIADPRLKT